MIKIQVYRKHELHKTYVFVPADKAVNNIIVVCRKYDKEVLCNEIHSSDTFQAADLTEQHIINEHLKVTIKFKSVSDNMKVPTIC